MMRFRTWALGLGLAVLLAAVGAAGAAEKGAKQKGKKGAAAAFDKLTQLLPPDPANKLKLTDDEQKQVAKIQDEYTANSKDSLAAFRDAFTQNQAAIKQARQSKDKAALKQATAPVRDKARDFLKVRTEYEAKVRDVLTEDQKKTLDELKAEDTGKGPLANFLAKGKKKNK